MGSTLSLRLIDHDSIIEKAGPVVDEAIAIDEPEILIEYICKIPVFVDAELLASHRQRCEMLRQIGAPAIILENEKRMLRILSGEAYSREALSDKNVEELREVLGMWCWVQSTRETAWYELDWFLQPADGPVDAILYPERPQVGDPSQTIFDQALSGSPPPPCDSTGAPLVRYCGTDPELFGYNPPDKVREIRDALSTIDVSGWSRLIAQRADQHRRGSGESVDTTTEIAEQELEAARAAFAILLCTYETANSKGFGVACEYVT